ncbi:hypothetical protein JVU11DRAFT_9533 [Chiua virens]|nr:hypothetical protein JVU11DRAFT_9533 [Chiua virens]
MSRSPQDVYARYLLSSRGYPLWVPEPSHDLLVRRPDGLRIGDVGVVVPEDGGFEVFFNICLPREHPFHRATGVPDNFRQLQLGDQDTRIIPNLEQPGRIISSSSVTRTRTIKLSSDGSSEATKHGIGWYRFAEENLGRMISHDSLYLITGFYKTRSWSLAAFENDAGSGEFSAQFKMTEVGGGNVAGTYTWETTRSLDWRVGPIENYGIDIPNQSVFIRGFKIALRRDVLGKRRVDVKVGAPNVDSNEETFSDASKHGSWKPSFWRGLSGDSRRTGAGMQDEVSASSSTVEVGDNPQSGAPDDADKHVVVEYVPESAQVCGPSQMLQC